MVFESTVSENASTSSLQFTVSGDDIDIFAFNVHIAAKTTSLEERMALLDDAAAILDSILDRVRSPLYSEALKLIDYPLMDIFEVTEALGWQNLSRLVRSAIDAVRGVGELPMRDVVLLADMMGWTGDPASVDSRVVGYAVILSITASFNKALNRIANEIGSDLQ